jgi:hypothetical protein
VREAAARLGCAWDCQVARTTYQGQDYAVLRDPGAAQVAAAAHAEMVALTNNKRGNATRTSDWLFGRPEGEEGAWA